MSNRTRLQLAFAALVVLSATVLRAAPQLSIPPFAYRLVSVTPVDSTQRVYDLTLRAGILNTGDLAVNVTAQLTSTSALISVLDGSVTFGDVAPTRIGRLAFSHDTFRLRLTLPRAQPLATVILIANSVLHDFQWTIACDNCGAQPIADAGPDQTAQSQQVVQLDGSGSIDPSGGTLTYAWTLVTAPEGSEAALQEPDSVRPTIRPDRDGDYVVQLVVRSAAGASLPDTVRVTTVNSAPVAKAGADQTVFADATVALDGTGSTDVDGDPLTYRWTIADAPDLSTAQIANPSAATASFVPDVIGTYRIDLIVNDGTVDSAPDTVVITTRPGNSAPVADAGSDQSLPLGAMAFLDGGASHDADGDPLTFAWSLLSRPSGSVATLSNAATTAPSFVLDAPGSYVAQLTVSDGQASGADTVVVSTLNGRPIAVPGPDQTVHFGAVATLDGRESRDPDGDALTFRWSLLNVPAGSGAQLSAPTSATPDFVADRPGLYTAQLIVNDGQIDSDPATVNVTATDTAPVARDDQATTSAGASVTIDVLSNDSDPDGDPLELASISSPPAHGAAAVVSSQVRYTPSDGFEGTDFFSYAVTDGVESATAIVTVFVQAVPPPPGPVARLELAPSAVLLTGIDETRGLEVRAFDATGAPTFVPAQVLEYLSSNEEQIQVVNGVVQALVIPGSALVRVRLTNDPSIVSAPVGVTAADVNPDVVVIADDEIMDEPLPVDIADRRYEVRLNRSFDAGTLILSSGGKPVMGRVVSVDPMAGDGTFRTEVRLAPLTEIFQNLALSYSFTPEELSGLTQAESAQVLAAPRHQGPARLSALASEPSSNAGACSLEFSSTELTGDITGNVTANLGFDLDLAINEGSLDRFKVIASGSLEGSLNLTASIGAAVEIEGSCKKKLATILVPIGGPLSLLVGARIPLGFSGSLALMVQQNLATVTVAQDLQADLVLGVFYEGGQFIPVNMLNVGTTPATTLVDIPASSLRFRGKAFIGGTAGISLGVLGTGFPLFDLAEVSGGPQFEARFGEPYDASTDTAYTPGYELKVVGKAGPGTDITNVFKEIFGALPPPFDLTLQFEFPWASSPQPGTVLKADRAAFAAGDTLTFRVDLAPGSESFPIVGYNVSEVRVYLRDEASASARLVASTPGVPGKTSFELTWMADRDGRTVNPTSGRDNFFAFVVPVLLSTPSASYPLELGALRGVAPIEIIPRDVVVGVGGTRQFSARVDGQDSTNVTWTATGGTISSSGFFQASNVPGTYTITVARADAPGVTDEATVEVRPHCVPGSGAGYCGFNYATVPLPGPFVWQSIGVNDNGDWVGVAEDGNGVRSVYIGRGNSFALAPGLNPPAGSTPFGVDRPVHPKLTNNNAFAGSFVTTTGTFRAFVFQNGAPLFLDPLPGDSAAFAYDVNEELVAVGMSFGQGGSRAVRWVNGVAEDLGLGTPSTAFAIDAHGRILVTTGDLHFLRGSSIQVWNAGAVTTLPDSQECQGVDINSSGDVVGTCIIDRTDPAHPVFAAFVWRNGDRQALDGALALNDSGDVLATYGLPGSSQRLWRDGVEHDIDRTGTYLSTPPNMANWLFTSLSPTKSILAGWSITCPTVTSCFSNVLIAYPIELVVP